MPSHANNSHKDLETDDTPGNHRRTRAEFGEISHPLGRGCVAAGAHVPGHCTRARLGYPTHEIRSLLEAPGHHAAPAPRLRASQHSARFAPRLDDECRPAPAFSIGVGGEEGSSKPGVGLARVLLIGFRPESWAAKPAFCRADSVRSRRASSTDNPPPRCRVRFGSALSLSAGLLLPVGPAQ